MHSDKDSTIDVHLICQAHIDPIWIWDWPEGLTETLSTFETAADLLDEFPEFVFNHNESLLYEWTKTYRPQLFERIRKHVEKGRWVISGGWYLQPDANLPAGESLARQILIGRRFFDEELGVSPRVAYNLDTFGHNANLPQFLKLAGYEMYTHFRPTPAEKTLPDFLYRWRGVDGTEVVGFRPPCGWYCTHPGSLVEHKIDDMRQLAETVGRPTTMFWGAGDHGGGATRDELELIRRIADRHPGLRHSSFERYYEDVAAHETAGLPLVTGELQKCFTGCYTSIIGNKLRNRRGEGYALAAERFAALAWWLTDEPYPAEALARIWKDVLFNQFHDILPGSSIREGAVSAAERIGRAVTDAKGILVKSQLELMRRTEPTEPLTVRIFNPHPVQRTIPAVLDIQLSTHPLFVKGKYLGVYDGAGNEITRQLLEYRRNTAEWRNTFLIEAELPPMGIAEYRIRIEEPAQDASCRVADTTRWTTVDEGSIVISSETGEVGICRRTGSLTSLVDHRSGVRCIDAPSMRLIVRADSNHAWGGSQNAYGPVVGAFGLPGADELAEITGQYGEEPPAAPVRLIASGPLAVVVESILRYKRSVARLRYTVYRHHPYIDIDLLLDWNERRRALQLEIATTIQGDEYETEVPHASVTRPRGGGEEPVGRWILLRDDRSAVAVVNDGPGGAEIVGSKIRQTLVRSPVYCSGSESAEPRYLGEHMDLGEHRYRFRLLYGPAEEIRAGCPLSADDVTLPFSYHCSVPLGASQRNGLKAGVAACSLTRIDGCGSVHAEAIKVSEDGGALVLRLVERTGSEAGVRVSLPPLQPFELMFRPFEIKTIRVEKAAGGTGRSPDRRGTGRSPGRPSWSECDLLERPLR